MRVRLKYSREGPCRFLSHLDMVRVFLRAMRRGRLPLAYSQGFNPQPRLAFAAPLPVGTAAWGEYLDVYLTAPMETEKLLEVLNREMPPGLKVLKAREVLEKGDSLMALVNTFQYRIELPGTAREAAAAALEKIKEAPRVPVRRKTKKGPQERDIKPYIKRIHLVEDRGPGESGEQGAEQGENRGQGWYLALILTAGPRGSVRPNEVLSALGMEEKDALITREGVYIAEGEKILTPFDR